MVTQVPPTKNTPKTNNRTSCDPLCFSPPCGRKITLIKGRSKVTSTSPLASPKAFLEIGFGPKMFSEMLGIPEKKRVDYGRCLEMNIYIYANVYMFISCTLYICRYIYIYMQERNELHPCRESIWNLKTTQLKRNIFFQTSIFAGSM